MEAARTFSLKNKFVFDCIPEALPPTVTLVEDKKEGLEGVWAVLLVYPDKMDIQCFHDVFGRAVKGLNKSRAIQLGIDVAKKEGMNWLEELGTALGIIHFTTEDFKKD